MPASRSMAAPIQPLPPKASASGLPLRLSYRLKSGSMYAGTIETFLASPQAARYAGKVQLIFTSPPFPLNRKKAYGNLQGDKFSAWLSGLAPRLSQLLTPTGSIVIEMGNAWVSGKPVMSVLALESLLGFLKAGQLHLAQQFVVYNPARLPSPAQWVNVERVRLKDAFTHVWWMAATEQPYADNRQVLKPYSNSMLKLLSTKKYNSGPRPSEHHIGAKSFLTNNNGAIPPNVITVANTRTDDPYQTYCRKLNLKPHPARMPAAVPNFFIRLLTKENDLVMDPFAGTNTTGAAAASLGRNWLGVEVNEEYARTSQSRFFDQ